MLGEPVNCRFYLTPFSCYAQTVIRIPLTGLLIFLCFEPWVSKLFTDIVHFVSEPTRGWNLESIFFTLPPGPFGVYLVHCVNMYIEQPSDMIQRGPWCAWNFFEEFRLVHFVKTMYCLSGASRLFLRPINKGLYLTSLHLFHFLFLVIP